jgi:hypothetical protein
MLHHHFLHLMCPFQDGFVSRRDIAQFVRANPATKPLPAIRRVLPPRRSADADILTRIFMLGPREQSVSEYSASAEL